MRNNIKGKVVIITGASSGIGKSCAFNFAQRGAKIVLVSRNREKLAKVESALKKMGVSTFARPTDISRYEDVKKMVKETLNHFGKIDILINNAGVVSRGLASSTPIIYLQKMMETNFYGTVYCIKEVYPYIKEQGGGIIVNVSSMAGLKGLPGRAFYSATKFAISGFYGSFFNRGRKRQY